jgi:hypothetical protein
VLGGVTQPGSTGRYFVVSQLILVTGPVYATDQWRQALATAACAGHIRLGPATLVLHDVTTLYLETDEGDGFREPGFSDERRLERWRTPEVGSGEVR